MQPQPRFLSWLRESSGKSRILSYRRQIANKRFYLRTIPVSNDKVISIFKQFHQMLGSFLPGLPAGPLLTDQMKGWHPKATTILRFAICNSPSQRKKCFTSYYNIKPSSLFFNPRKRQTVWTIKNEGGPAAGVAALIAVSITLIVFALLLLECKDYLRLCSHNCFNCMYYGFLLGRNDEHIYQNTSSLPIAVLSATSSP